MNFLKKCLQNYQEKDDILSKSLLIAEKKKENPAIINATLGTLKDESGQLAVLGVVDEVLKNLPDEQFYAYSDTAGPEKFNAALSDYLFGIYREEIQKRKFVSVLPTPGATGALNLALFLGCECGDQVILPALCWSVYENMCQGLQLKIYWYDYIKENRFDLQGFKQAVTTIKRKQKQIVTILNDPCNNPTGYSLTEQELQDLLIFIESEKEISFTLIYDIAYFEYGKEDARKKFALLAEAPSNCLVIIAFSASKAFTIYGLRMGAMIVLHDEEKDAQHYFHIAKSIARTHWSCVSTPSLSMFIALFEEKQKRLLFEKQRDLLRKMLLKRADLFTCEAKKVALPMIPYHGGFFVAVYSHDAKELAERLAQKDVYVLAFSNVIRIGICSITLAEIPLLVRKVKECL